MFFVTHGELTRLSGRSRTQIYQMRATGKLPYEKVSQGTYISDIDDPDVRKFAFSHPKSCSPGIKSTLNQYREEFTRKRQAGEITCAKTKQVDFMASFDVPHGDILAQDYESTLDIQKKEQDLAYKAKQTEKLEMSIKAVSGDLIDRVYVETWVHRYLGDLHRQALGLPATGLGTELVNIVLKEMEGDKDIPKAIKAVDRELEQRLSRLLKDTRETMRSNPL